MKAKRRLVPDEVVEADDLYDSEYSESENLLTKEINRAIKSGGGKYYRIEQVEEFSFLEALLIDYLLGTQVFEVGGVTVQLSSIVRKSDDFLPFGTEDPDSPDVIGVTENGVNVYYVKESFLEKEKLDTLTELETW